MAAALYNWYMYAEKSIYKTCESGIFLVNLNFIWNNHEQQKKTL